MACTRFQAKAGFSRLWGETAMSAGPRRDPAASALHGTLLSVAKLRSMPPINLGKVLPPYGKEWLKGGGKLPGKKATGYNSAAALGNEIDQVFAHALARFLGDVDIHQAPRGRGSGVALHPPAPDCVEFGDVTIAGGARTQRFDVAYRPDGARIAFDNKTLNGEDSMGKNWNNMVNDLVAEATTVHHRFPDSVVAFFILVPEPVLAKGNRLEESSRSIARIGGRVQAQVENLHLAEAICLAAWDPATGIISKTKPDPATFAMIRIENFASTLEERYRERFKFAPPH